MDTRLAEKQIEERLKEHNKEFLDDSLPCDLTGEIVTVAGDGDYRKTTRVMARLSGARKGHYALFKPELDKRKNKQALIAVLQGNEEEVLYFAKNHPELFFIKIEEKIKDYAMDLDGNCREIEGWSAYQAIFGTGDKDMLWDITNNKPSEIKCLLDAYLATLPDGQQLAQTQEQEKFPNGFDYPESTYDFTLLVDTIANDQQLIDTGIPSEATLAVLAAFRADFKPGVVKTGYHFNLNDFVKAEAIYRQKWLDNSWNGYQLNYFSGYITGFLERLLSAPFMQRACQGIVNQDKPLKRSYEVTNYAVYPPKKVAIFPLDMEPAGGRLGDGFFVDYYYGVVLRAREAARGLRRDGVGRRRRVGNLCQAITAVFSRLVHTSSRKESLRV